MVDRSLDDEQPIARPTPRWPRIAIAVALVLVLVAHLAWHLGFVEAGYASPDANGYYAQARMIATEGRTGFEAESPVEHIGIHWLEAENGRFFSRYPAGLPTLLAGAWLVGGPDAPFYVDTVLLTLTLLALFLLCRPWVGGGLALAAVIVLAAHPTVNHHAHFGFAHTSVTFFLVAGIWLLDSWARNQGRWRAFGAGLLLGIVPTIRYAEGIAALGVGVFLVWYVLRRRNRAREAAFALLGAAIPIAILLLHNQLAFGAPWRTGYSLTSEQTGFSWDWFAQHIDTYREVLMTSGMAGNCQN